ncbi:extensin, partial [Streptomyces sp. NPDC019396]
PPTMRRAVAPPVQRAPDPGGHTPPPAPPAVQRAATAPRVPPSASATAQRRAAGPPPPPTKGAGDGAPPPHGPADFDARALTGAQIDELTHRLIGPLTRLLRTELRLDRERIGRLRDPRH